MSESSVMERIRSIISESLGLEEQETAAITMDTKLVEDLNVDSLDLLESMMEMESQFGISIEDDEAAKMVTIGDIVRFIESQKN